MSLVTPGCSAYIRWRLIYEYLSGHSIFEAHKNLCLIFGYEIISENDCKEWFRQFSCEDQNFEKIAHKPEFDHLRFLYELKHNPKFFDEARKKKPKNVEEAKELAQLPNSEIIKLRKALISKPEFRQNNYEFGKMFSQLANEINNWDSFWATTISVLTPLCFVTFTPNMEEIFPRQMHFPTPTDFDPPKNPFTRLFEESYLIMKNVFQHISGRRWSLHEIICDLYDCDPRTTWLSDDDIFMLPLFFGENNSPENLPRDLFYQCIVMFYDCFSNDDLHLMHENTIKKYSDKFCSKVVTIVNNVSNSTFIKKNDKNSTQREIFLCGFYSFLEAYMENITLSLFELKGLEVLPYYVKVWKTLIVGSKEIVIRLRGRFSEENSKQFCRLMKAGIHYWKKIWFHEDLIPRLIKQIYDNAMYKGLDMSHLITIDLINSYKMLRIYKDDITEFQCTNPSQYEYYRFMKWHIDKLPSPSSTSNRIKISGNKRKRGPDIKEKSLKKFK